MNNNNIINGLILFFLLISLFLISNTNLEKFTDMSSTSNEGIQNLASAYNTGTATLTNLEITGNFKIGNTLISSDGTINIGSTKIAPDGTVNVGPLKINPDGSIDVADSAGSSMKIFYNNSDDAHRGIAIKPDWGDLFVFRHDGYFMSDAIAANGISRDGKFI